MEGLGVLSSIPKPLPNEQTEQDYYCSVDSSYCTPDTVVENNGADVYKAVCSVKGGTALCKNVKSFEEFYTSPPDCKSGVCIPRKSVSQSSVDKIHDSFLSFYGDIPFTKLKNNGKYSVYVCKIVTGLLINNYYLFAIVSADSREI